MGRILRSSKFFEHTLGAKLRNVRQSWGATNPNTKQIFLKVWEDQAEFRQGVEHYQILGTDWKSRSLGFPEQKRHIAELRKGAEGFGVVCVAKDPSGYPRSIKSFDPDILLKFGNPIDVGKRVLAPVVAHIPVDEALYSPMAHDLKEILDKPVDPTTKRALFDARLGQGQFREHVLQRWGFRCCVTGSTTHEAIIASHIKPWKDSNDHERRDPHNGLPLIATVDKLFDKGLVTFSSDGVLLISKELDANEKALLGLDGRKLLRQPGHRTAEYLAYHRTSIFLDEQTQKKRR